MDLGEVNNLIQEETPSDPFLEEIVDDDRGTQSQSSSPSRVNSRALHDNGSFSNLPASALASRPITPSSSLSQLPRLVSNSSDRSGPQAGLVNCISLPSSQFLRHRKAFASRALAKDQVPEKPWLDNKARKRSDKKAYWLFVSAVALGVLGMALVVYFAGVAQVPVNKYCLVLQDDFDGETLNTDIWFHEQETGGFGNGEFEWTTDSVNNSYVRDGNLYIVPTLTSDQFGEGAITNGFTLNLTQSGTCTASNKTDASCAVASNSTTGTILPPIQSARLVTNFSRTIKYGRVEVRARMPTGDWLWPAIWMMPKDSVYGAWPKSGEIDIVETVGNVATKRAQNLNNVFKSSLHWGPSPDQDRYSLTTHMRKLYRNFFNQDYHTFGLEWTPEGIFTYESSPVFKVLSHKFDESFWQVGEFPSATSNGTQIVDPWSGATNAAPFDQEFFLILNVAVGGTNGFFSETEFPNKPWSNNAENAVADFWKARDQWLPTWPEDKTKRGMAIDYVKMYQLCN